ncbi:Uncharacterized protein Rs2_02106 [Raphanus sativus]|nr:Uncharacterized protein Rs2_02106 [Raphanus sativus]
MFSLSFLRFWEVEASTAPSPPALTPGDGSFYSSAIVGSCFREAVAYSALLSSALVLGRSVVVCGGSAGLRIGGDLDVFDGCSPLEVSQAVKVALSGESLVPRRYGASV